MKVLLDTKILIDSVLGEFTLLRDERGIFDLWSNLVSVHQVSGKNAHDARLVAAMQRHAIANLITFNEADFKRFAINVLTPQSVIAGVKLV